MSANEKEDKKELLKLKKLIEIEVWNLMSEFSREYSKGYSYTWNWYWDNLENNIKKGEINFNAKKVNLKFKKGVDE